MRLLSILFVLSSFSSLASSQIVWDEGVNGDLSGDRLAPTNLQLSVGTNSLLATSVQGDREYVHFHLGGGLTLEKIVPSGWVGIDEIAFIAVQSGSVFTEPHQGTVVGNLLGYAHFGPGVNNMNVDILADMGTAPGAIGFTPPLSGTDYTFWIQQTSPNPVSYQLDFVVAPEPSSLLLLIGAGLAARRRRS